MNLTANISEQIGLFVYSLVLGAALGILFCAFKILKVLLGGTKTVGAVLDLIYFPAAAVIFFFFTVGLNSGQWRLYMVIGVLIGAAGYALTLGRVLTNPVCRLIESLQKILVKILRKFKGKIVKIPLKKKVLVLYNKFIHKRSTENGTKSKGKSKQEQDN